jgi:hypothetical protein
MIEKRKNRELWESKTTSSKERKYIDYTLRRYIEKQFDSFDNLLQVLDALPDDQIKSVLTPKHMADLLKVLEKSLEIFPPAYVEQDEKGEYQTTRYYQVIFGSDFAKFGEDDASSLVNVACPASDEEIEYWKMFEYSSNYLFKRISEMILDIPMLCTTKQLNTVILPELNKIANKRGAFCKVESAACTPIERKKSSKSTKKKPA